MAYQSITTLALRDDVDWPALSDRLEQLAQRVAEHSQLRSIQLVRVESERAVLVVGYADEASMHTLLAELVEPWLREQLEAWLSEPVRTESGETVFSLTRAEDDEVASIEALDGPERLAHFVETVASAGSLWGLYGKTWARSSAIEDTEALPFWPTMKLAARNCQEQWGSFVPREIDLEAFVDQWLTGMQEDGIVAVVAPTPTHPGFCIDPAELAKALRRDGP